MRITKLSVDGFKNLENIDISPCGGINIFCGDNAQGKTNLLEVLDLFCGKSEFRTSKESERIAFSRDMAVMSAEFCDDEDDETFLGEMAFGRKNRFRVNKVDLKSVSAFSKYIQSVAFGPGHIDIVDGQAEVRRSFLDAAVFELRQDYLLYLKRYKKALKHKNTILKETAQGWKNRQDANCELDIFDEQLAALGTVLTILREDYIKKIKNICEDVYSGISKDKEKMEIAYRSTVFDGDIDSVYNKEKVSVYLNKLKGSREEDIYKKFTTVGAHRDDLIINIDKRRARDYGSRGQKRSCAIALKLSEAKIIETVKKTKPIILLDDIMSELDKKRQEYILNSIENSQVFITCCDVNNTLSLKDGNVFYVKDGKVVDKTFKDKEITN